MKKIDEKEHEFLVRVRGVRSRKEAEQAIKAAFALRDPDGCRFKLHPWRQVMVGRIPAYLE